MNKRFALWPVNNGYIDNLLAPEKRATSPSSSDIINGFSLEDDNHYNEFQSDSNTRNIHLSKAPLFCYSFCCFLPVICQ
jgi:hypothetical protein